MVHLYRSSVAPRLADLRAGHRLGIAGLLAAALAGILVSCLAVYAYYNDPWRPLGHTVGPWIALTYVLGIRQKVILSIARAVTSLVSAVVAFYIGLKVLHDIRWAAKGSVMGIAWDRLMLWTMFGVVAGVALGLLAAQSARRGWWGAASTGALIGLILADAVRQALSAGSWNIGAMVDVALALGVGVLATRANRAPWRSVLVSLGACVLGLVVLSVPDLIEQLRL